MKVMLTVAQVQRYETIRAGRAHRNHEVSRRVDLAVLSVSATSVMISRREVAEEVLSDPVAAGSSTDLRTTQLAHRRSRYSERGVLQEAPPRRRHGPLPGHANGRSALVICGPHSEYPLARATVRTDRSRGHRTEHSRAASRRPRRGGPEQTLEAFSVFMNS